MIEDYKITIVDQDDLVYELESIGVPKSFLILEAEGTKYVETENNYFPFNSIDDFTISEDKAMLISKDDETNEISTFTLNLEQFNLLKDFIL